MIRYFAGHPTAANLLMLAIAALGLLALPDLQRDTFPVVPPTEVEVRIRYPGATPAEVEEGICLPAEDAIDLVARLEELRCDARESLAVITARMEEGADMDAFSREVDALIGRVDGFPDKAELPSVEVLERVASVAGVMITGAMAPAELAAYADSVKTRLERDPRIAQVRVLGFPDQELVIEVPAEAQRRFSLGIADVRAVIERQSLDMPAGIVGSADGDWTVRLAGQRRMPSEFADLVIVSSVTGAAVRLGDIARISTRFDRPEERIFFNGERAALLEVAKNASQDSIRVMAALQENLERERVRAPPGVSLEVSQDVTANIRDRLRLLIDNGVQGLALVFLALWAFFSLRFSFWVVMGLPVSFLGAIFVMHAFGYTLNMMTMVALLVAVGLLMDDAIVIAENIAVQARKGASTGQAAVQGTLQVLPGVLSSFFTTVVIMAPLAFMAGKMGAVLKSIPAVLIIALAVSLVEALFILPAHLAHALAGARETRTPRVRRAIEDGFDVVRDRLFAPLVERVAAQPYLTLGIIAALVIGSFATIPAGLLKYRALPELESDVIQARILLAQGQPLALTEAVVARVVRALEGLDAARSPSQPGARRLVRNVSILYDTHADAHESGPHLATVSADLLPATVRVDSIDEILADWRARTGDPPDVLSLSFTDRERGVAGKAIEVRLQGESLDALKRASLDLQRWLEGFDGVLDLSDDLRLGKPGWVVRPRVTAGALGLTARDMADELRAAVNGSTALRVRAGAKSQDVVVRLADGDAAGIDDIRDLTVRAGAGALVPLSAVAEILPEQGYARIHRVDGQRTVTLQGALDTNVANARELVAMTRTVFLPGFRERHPEVGVSFVGQERETATTSASLQKNVLIGLIGVFLILAFQFRSYVQPLAVLLSVPTGFIGVVWGHLAMGLELSMPSLVGLATLTGIVVNDSILLVGFVRDRAGAGVPIDVAVREAAVDRFRAVVLTSATTIAGLLPLLMETSTQAQFLIPLVASLAFGLLAATLGSLIMIPAFFVVFHDLGLFAGGGSVDSPRTSHANPLTPGSVASD